MRLVTLNPKPRDGREAFRLIRERVGCPVVAIYNVSEGHLECAPDASSPKEVERKYGLDSSLVRQIKSIVGNDVHVILAYDFTRKEVYIIDAVPELQIASAVLTVLFAEMLGGGCNKFVDDKEKCPCEEDDTWSDESDENWDDDLQFDEMFEVTHAKNRDEDYLGGLKRLKPSFELTF